MPDGYAGSMTDSQTPETPETKAGPANPQARGVDAPTPPEGPQRQDRAEGGLPGGHDDEVSGGRAANKSAEEAGGHTIPIEDEQPEPHADRDGSDVQRETAQENAETSLDQPSEG